MGLVAVGLLPLLVALGLPPQDPPRADAGGDDREQPAPEEPPQEDPAREESVQTSDEIQEERTPEADAAAAFVEGVLTGEWAPEDLAGLGPVAAPLLLECLASDSLPSGGPLGPEAEQRALDAFAALPVDTWRPALRVLQVVGAAEDLQLAVDLCEQATQDDRSRVARALAPAAEAVLTRDERAWVPMQVTVVGSSPPTADALLAAVGRVGGARALDLLGELLGSAPERDWIVLSQIGVVAGGLAEPPPEPLLARTRALLGDGDMQLVRAAATAAAELGDHGALADLIALLANDSASVRATAAWALARLTGLRLGEDRGRWQGWFEGESAWYAARAEDLFDELEASDPRRIRRALHELGRHRFRVRAVAERVAETLSSPHPSVRATACSVLAGLGSRTSTEALVERLDDEFVEVAEAAQRALVTLTGLELPADRFAWEAALADAGAAPDTRIQ